MKGKYEMNVVGGAEHDNPCEEDEDWRGQLAEEQAVHVADEWLVSTQLSVLGLSKTVYRELLIRGCRLIQPM